ncbi:DUF4232 domain-containing protein [Nocardia sp. ET3-3]|uniref:DUF4232 domain-containing protein n=1 Tax=Nocardia terrae TaxID=2675851 RepID=A0A7K1V4V5_9NOCA|nr:DUF4232 domain-containing protein [Nocardia terrae]MVU81654.1 DUF4232 domain-containing protein [Nocardia terrae]
MKKRFLGAVLFAGALTAVTTGCTPDGSVSVTVSPAPTTGAASTGTPTGGGQSGDGGAQAGDGGASTGTPAPTAAPVSECTNGQIHVRAENLDGGNKNYNGTLLIFETTGDASCWLVGYPGVDMWSPGDKYVHASRTQYSAVFGQNPDHSWVTPQQITVKPGQPAHAVLENTVTDNGRPCPISHTLNVTPPDMTATQPVETGAVHPCSVVIHPITQ